MNVASCYSDMFEHFVPADAGALGASLSSSRVPWHGDSRIPDVDQDRTDIENQYRRDNYLDSKHSPKRERSHHPYQSTTSARRDGTVAIPVPWAWLEAPPGWEEVRILSKLTGGIPYKMLITVMAIEHFSKSLVLVNWSVFKLSSEPTSSATLILSFGPVISRQLS